MTRTPNPPLLPTAESRRRGAPVPPSSRPEKRPVTKSTGGRSSGYLTVFTVPSSKVYLGGRLLGNSPIAKRQVPAGRHTLKLVSPNGSKSVSVTVKAGEVARVRQRL